VRFILALIITLLAGCATVVVAFTLDERFGPPDRTRFDHPLPPATATAPDYWSTVRPILDHRCVSCHACYDSPCQLNLSSYAGLTRGASGEPVYANRLISTQPTRLGIDARTNLGWREMGFFPVLNERRQSPEANREGGVLYRLLTLKQSRLQPERDPHQDDDLDLSLNRQQVCPRVEAMDDFSRSHPGWGMPFALPALTPSEHGTLARWIEAGAPYTPPAALPTAVNRRVADWERLLNGDTAQARLVGRYIYEHWYIGHFHFPESPRQQFELVRSRTPPGQAIDLIATRRPYDDPGVERVYYRLRRSEATPVAKTHMPIELTPARLERLRQWFFATPYEVRQLPSYRPEEASNPFLTFRSLPISARYRFMLDEAQFTVMGFMKGPVCRGQVALNVINDHFWIIFLSPTDAENKLMEQMLDATLPNLRLPAEQGGEVGLLSWLRYAESEKNYMEAKSAILARVAGNGQLPRLDHVWDGDGKNPNAALTVFRHFDSASVVQGLVGQRPQTMLFLGYPLLERMHYLLVAGYDVYGNIGHQLETRLYMDFLRMEGELSFLSFLPIKDRQAVLNHWYRGRSAPQIKYFADARAYFPLESSIRYRTANPLDEFYQMLQARFQNTRNKALDWVGIGLTPTEIGQFQRLSALHGMPAAQMPEQSLLLLRGPDQRTQVVSLLRHAAHSNISELFNEEARRLPEEDRLEAIHGVVGAYPNAIFVIDTGQLKAFADAVSRIAVKADLDQLLNHYAIRRNDPRFWKVSDEIQDWWEKAAPNEAAILDFSRFDANGQQEP